MIPLIFHLILLNDANALKQLLDLEPSASKSRFRNHNTLSYTILHEAVNCFHILIEYDVDKEMDTTRDVEDLLATAASSDNANYLKILMEIGHRFIGTPCIDMALYNDLPEMLNIFLNYHPEINKSETSHGYEPNILSLAVKLGAKKFVKMLRELAPPNILLCGISSANQSLNLFSFKTLFNMAKSANNVDPFISFEVLEKSTWEPRQGRVKKQIVNILLKHCPENLTDQNGRNALHHVADLPTT